MNLLDELNIYIKMQNIYLLKYIAYKEGWDYKNLIKYL